MTTNTLRLYRATQSLFRALHYLRQRMEGGAPAPPQPINGRRWRAAFSTAAWRNSSESYNNSQPKRTLWFAQP